MREGKSYTTLSLVVFVSIFLSAQIASYSEAQVYTPPERVELGAGDALEIRFFYAPELNEEMVVRPDGKIALQLIGEIDVTGKTPDELRRELETLYSEELRNPMVSVIVRSLYSRRVYVAGEVHMPGVIEMPGRMSIRDAIFHAGGFDLRTAKITDVIVIRQTEQGNTRYHINMRRMMNSPNEPDFFLEPYDTIFVGRTRVARMNQWVDQYVNGIIPQVILSTIPFVIYRNFFG